MYRKWTFGLWMPQERDFGYGQPRRTVPVAFFFTRQVARKGSEVAATRSCLFHHHRRQKKLQKSLPCLRKTPGSVCLLNVCYKILIGIIRSALPRLSRSAAYVSARILQVNIELTRCRPFFTTDGFRSSYMLVIHGVTLNRR